MSITLTSTQKAIIKQLLDEPEKQSSIREIARTLKKSYSLTYNNIKDLTRKKIIQCEEVPPAKVVKLHDNIPTGILIDIERQRTTEFIDKHFWISLYIKDVQRTAQHPFFTFLVFGSYVKGTHTPKSDIDLLFIVPTVEEIDRFESAANHYTKVKKHIQVVDFKSFVDMIKNANQFNIGNEARKHHIVLYNTEGYYELLERANQ